MVRRPVLGGTALGLTGFPFFSPDGRRAVYAGERDGGMFVQDGDKEGPPYKVVRYLVLSPDAADSSTSAPPPRSKKIYSS